MKVEYVTDTSHWEKWQRDYRLGLILIMPPAAVADQINPLRAKHDPYAYAICPAHITLSDPLGHEMTPEREAEIRSILTAVEPFTIHFDKPWSSPERGGVAYWTRPREPFDALRATLHTASVFVGEPYYTRKIGPHMTIAEFLSIEESAKLCAQLKDTAPRGSFLCDRLEFIVPDQDFHFQRAGGFFLGTGGSEKDEPQQCNPADCVQAPASRSSVHNG
jgi:2'-5' RNA ligase